ERMEQTDSIRAAPHTSDQGIGQFACLRQTLSPRFATDDRLKITHQLRIRVRASHGTNNVEGVVDVSRPITHRFVHGIFKSTGTGLHRKYFSTQEFHAIYVE